MSKKNSTIFMCESCGNEFSTWAGKCTMCGDWNSLKEINYNVEKSKSRNLNTKLEISKISDVVLQKDYRIPTKISEFDRVLGGGIVPGSIILLGGEPGIGKSTILLELANNIDNTFYLSAEESVSQIKMRADRMGVKNETILMLSESDLDSVLHEVAKIKPKLLIIDSIQTVFVGDSDATPGSVVQVRECGIKLQQFAKSHNISVILVGHVTKEGNLAGPRILEHLVDTVLYLEGERYNDSRILRGVKNRFGATNEVGIFSMKEEGLVEIKNPSELFLSEFENGPGSVITVALEGNRPILIEVQALVIPTHFGYPKRTSSGFDLNRLNLLAAVITKKTKADLSNFDIYLNVIGGIRLSEPAADLAVCAALLSSFKNKAFAKDVCIFGEVGLGGEIRNVLKSKDREKEATTLGYKLLPKFANVRELFELI
ncbi:MAG: DNA repair protein RadA [bacterium]